MAIPEWRCGEMDKQVQWLWVAPVLAGVLIALLAVAVGVQA